MRFDLPSAAPVRIAVHDVSGPVRVLAGGEWPAGHHRMVWDGKDGAGRPVGAGIYLVRMESERFEASRRLVLIR